MNWQNSYMRWKEFPNLDPSLKEKLAIIETNKKLLEDSFYKNLEFGTGGIRGELGPGTNRMNIYTIRKATEGLARFIEQFGKEAKNRGVVIAYDCRHQSPEFALEAAKTLGKHRIQTYLFESLRPSPVLSFAVRYLHAFSGIVITASHNPPEYNGYKVYGDDGGQYSPEIAEEIISKVNEVEDELSIEVADETELKKSGLLLTIGKTIDHAYQQKLQSIIINNDVIEQASEDFTIVYTPLHGTGYKPVVNGLQEVGFKNVLVVEEQKLPDPNFSTVKSPNPEEHATFELAIQYGTRSNADILLGTDPDADRIGVAAINHSGEYQVFTGNQVGALLLHYLITEKTQKSSLSQNPVVLKTIVTSEMGRDIAAAYGIETIDTLTGFKYIGEKIREFEQTGDKNFLFGYEESYGCLIGDFVRDKDAVQACIMIAEVAAYYKLKNMTLFDALQEIQEKFGFYEETLLSLTFKGKDGVEKIEDMMDYFRTNPPKEVIGKKVIIVEDYKTKKRSFMADSSEEEIQLPQSNVLKFILDGGAWFCLRPSGTEPKIKFYFGVKEDTKVKSMDTLHALKDAVTGLAK